MIEYVRDAIRRGLKVSPLRPLTKDQPLTPNGFVDATNNLETAERWWARWPTGNTACSAGVVFDGDHGISDFNSFENFRLLLGLPRTLTVRTGRRPEFGFQMHFTGTATSHHYEWKGVTGEIRGHNLYGIWAGSIHPESRERYEILVDLPIQPWPESCPLNAPRRDSKDEKETTIEKARATFEWLLYLAAHSRPGNRHHTAHDVAAFSARASLAGVFEESQSEIARRIGAAVRPRYRPGERDVGKMLNDSWRWGFGKGPLLLDFYPKDFKRLQQLSDDDRFHRAFDGDTRDFPSGEAAREYVRTQLSNQGFDENEIERILRHSRLDEAVAAELLKEIEG